MFSSQHKTRKKKRETIITYYGQKYTGEEPENNWKRTAKSENITYTRNMCVRAVENANLEFMKKMRKVLWK